MIEFADVIQADLAQRRTALPVADARHGQLEQPVLPEQPAVVPSAIEVEYWREDDGTWAAHSALLGVSATANSEPEIFGAMADAIDEFWDILNQRYASLSDELRNLLAVRYQNLLFRKHE
jgi:hypothetical protein